MSGTSLDGVDLAYCEFRKTGNTWNYSIRHAITYPYTDEWKEKLQQLPFVNAEKFADDVNAYSVYIGNLMNHFILEYQLDPDFISSHGHTIFHQPRKHFTYQAGNGCVIAAVTGRPVVCDFRTTDMALGGQGAPLVPVGDKLLFGKYKYCLNLGGFANISYDEGSKRIAFDISPVNIILNYLCSKIGFSFDEDGMNARKGNIDLPLLDNLNALDYYRGMPPKSLSREWLTDEFLPCIEKSGADIISKLRTVTEHIATQISKVIKANPGDELFISGGGAHNRFLVEKINEHLNIRVIIPDSRTVDYKEALIFAFLGVLRMRNEVNCLSSVTGAVKDSVCGAVCPGPEKKRPQKQ